MARKKKSLATGCLFWASLVIVLVIAAIAAREPIQKALDELFGGKKTSPAPEVTMKPLPEKEKEDSNPPSAPAAGGSGTESGDKAQPEPRKQPVPAPQIQPPSAAVEKPAVRKQRLFFASVDTNGKIVLKGVIRPIPASDSPLRDTLQSLLQGPTSSEVNLGFLTMIPAGTKLRGVTVRGDTAYIDFNESFRFNTLGREGLNAQLRQIVFAATEFPTVKKVQILIEGKKVQYLGPEGIRIDAPLGRLSFQD
jgi:germination protein M